VHLADSVFTLCNVQVGAETRQVPVPKGGANATFSIPILTDTRVKVTVTGLSPGNCGNTTALDSIWVYPSAPLATIISAAAPNATSLSIIYIKKQDVGYLLRMVPPAPAQAITLQDSARPKALGSSNANFLVPTVAKYQLVYTQQPTCPQAVTDSLPVLNPRAGAVAGTLAFNPLFPYSGTTTILVAGAEKKQLAPTDTLYQDPLPYRCNEQRCYQLKTVFGAKSYVSYPVCLRKTTGSALLLLLKASTWDFAASKHRLRFDSAITLAALIGDGISQASATPPTVLFATPGCKTIGYEDSCGNKQPADSAYCPFLLQGQLTKDIRQLSWQLPKGQGLQTAFDVYIKVSTQDGIMLAFYAADQAGQFADRARFSNQRLVYQAYAIPTAGGTDTSTSNPIELVRTPALELPEAFSPNGDAKNDSLVARTRFMQRASITIFDAWGTAVYRSGLPFAWDGTGGAGKCAPGIYVAVIQATTQEGATFLDRKWVTIAP